MFTKISTIEELKEVFTEMLLNKTDKVSKVSDGSVLNAIAFGAAKLAQKTQTNVAVLESHLFPDTAFGEQLDADAKLLGVSQRFGLTQSSTYIRLVATPGTIYNKNTVTFTSNSGIQFTLEQDVTVPDIGYTYAKIRSVTKGSSSIVESLSIVNIANQPDGHIYCINEYRTQYGMNLESDDSYRKRIKEGSNIMARGTLSSIEQALMKINENVLKVFHNGFDDQGRTQLTVLSVNGTDFTDNEFSDMILKSEKFLSLTEMRPTGMNSSIIVLKNPDWQYIDITMWLQLEKSYNPDDVRKDIQIRLAKYLDYRYWKTGSKVEWDNLLEIVKNTKGVKYVNDTYFSPNKDVYIDINKLPRIRGFIMRDLKGNIIVDMQGNLNPVYYPNSIDLSYQSSVLTNL